MIDLSYFQHEDVVFLAKDLIGKKIVTNAETSMERQGIICETEAYNGIHDKACHAYANRKTARTSTMYLSGGHTYVYLCYGVHYLLNIVTSLADDPKAVLIRGIIPIHILSSAKNKENSVKYNSGIGPGRVTKYLGIDKTYNALKLNSAKIYIEEFNKCFKESDIIITTRIGIDYAGDDAKLPYRFVLNEDKVKAIFEKWH